MRITVRDLMVPAAAVVNERATVAAARDLMLRWSAGEAYVIDRRGRLLGVVPDYEFLKAELSGTAASAPVKTLVSVKVESVDADADVGTVISKFREGWCGRMAVTSKGKLVGRLTRAEVLRLVAHLRTIAATTEATAEAAIVGPHFESKPGRPRLAPVRKLSNSRSRGGRKLRRLKAG